MGDTIIAIEDEDVKQCPPSDIFVSLMLMSEASISLLFQVHRCAQK